MPSSSEGPCDHPLVPSAANDDGNQHPTKQRRNFNNRVLAFL